MRLYDNTRLSDYKRCPRFYYYRHIRDWSRDHKSAPLVFGGAWHAAMEVIWPALLAEGDIPRETLLKAAWTAFHEYWVGEGYPATLTLEQEQEMAPRTPGQAYELLAAYIEARERIKGDFELLSVERPFAVPLFPDVPDLFYVGKIDKICRSKRHAPGKVIGIEHKTTTAYSKAAKFRSTFLESFSPNSQVDGYLYALHMSFPGQVSGVWVDASLVHKTDEGFKFIPIEKQMEQLEAWRFDTLSWIARLEADLLALQTVSPDHHVMEAFPKNTNSCNDFNTACMYMDQCKAWANPHGKPTPPGFTEWKWDPLAEIPNLDKVLGGQDG